MMWVIVAWYLFLSIVSGSLALFDALAFL